MKYYLILSILFCVFSVSYAQCDLSTTGIGTFEGINYGEWSYLNRAGGSALGVFSSVSTTTHLGTGALEVDVSIAHPWGVRMYHKCNNSLTIGNYYAVSFWVYGGNGKNIKAALQHNDSGTNVIEEVTIELISDSWKEYSAVFISDGNYSKGKVKLTFPEVGVY